MWFSPDHEFTIANQRYFESFEEMRTKRARTEGTRVPVVLALKALVAVTNGVLDPRTGDLVGTAQCKVFDDEVLDFNDIRQQFPWGAEGTTIPRIKGEYHSLSYEESFPPWGTNHSEIRVGPETGHR